MRHIHLILGTLAIGTLGLGLTACGDKDDGPGGDDTSGLGTDSGEADTDSDTDDDTDSGTDDDTDAGPDPITATVSGTITVEAYTDGPDGRVSVDEATYFGGAFPYGPIFVAATAEAGTGLDYVGSDAILTPAFTGNTYELTVTMPAEGTVGVYGTLDEAGDLVIATDEPIGVHPDELDITDGAVITGVDITILVEVPDGSGSGSGGSGDGGGSGSGGSGGDACDIAIDGDFSITSTAYTAGTAALAMLTTTAGVGPTDFAWVSPTATATGADGSYALEVCPDQGAMNLVGAYDSNTNGLIDPADTWGAYVSAPDTDGNPISIGAADLTGYEIQVPIGEGESPLSVVPFVSISGEVTVGGGTFDDLPAGSDVYVAALKYRPSGALSTASIESDAYDLEKVEWPDLTGNSSFTYDLGVPAGSVVYLWAYADEDVDGLVNESGEAIASGGTDDNGRLETGSTDQTQNLALGYAGSR